MDPAQRLAEKVRGLAALPPPQDRRGGRHWRGFLVCILHGTSRAKPFGACILLGRVREMAGKSKNDWLLTDQLPRAHQCWHPLHLYAASGCARLGKRAFIMSCLFSCAYNRLRARARLEVLNNGSFVSHQSIGVLIVSQMKCLERRTHVAAVGISGLSICGWRLKAFDSP